MAKKQTKPRRADNARERVGVKAETKLIGVDVSVVKRLKKDFVAFCKALWKVKGYDKVAPIGPAEEQMMRWMNGEDNAPNHRGVLAPRSIGKTHIASALAIHRLMNDPDEVVLLIMRAERQAQQTLKLIRGWVNTVSFLRHLRPQKDAGHRDTAYFFDVGTIEGRRRSPSLAVGSVDGTLEGRRASFLIADDVETDRNTMTVEMRLALDQRVREFARVCSYGNREIVYIGTYHDNDSVYWKLHQRGYQFRTWPMLYPHDEEMETPDGDPRMINVAPQLIKDMNSGKAKPGDRVFKHRHSRSYVKECQSEGEESWNMHYMLSIAMGDTKRYPLKLRDLIVFNGIAKDRAPMSIAWGMTDNSNRSTAVDGIPSYGFGDDCLHRPIYASEEWLPYKGTKMFIDPSGRGDNRTGFACVAYLNGRLWVTELGSLAGGYDTATLDRLCLIAKNNRATQIYVEDEFGQGMFQPLLEERLRRSFEQVGSSAPSGDVSGPGAVEDARRHVADRHRGGWAATVESIRNPRNASKEDRIVDELEPIASTHRLIIDEITGNNRDFQIQWTRIRRVPKALRRREASQLSRDDEIDALASCCRMWRDRLDVSPQEAEELINDEFIDDALTEMRGAGAVMSGQTQNEGVWFVHT